jgi:hypothetical protein
MARRLCLLLLFFGVVVGLGGAALAIAPAGLAAESPFEVVARSLDNPRGLDFEPGGALYIAEAGIGGDGRCIPGPLGPMCYGATGAVTRVLNGEQERVVEGLPSLSGQNAGGNFSFGPHDIAIQDGQALIAIGLDATATDRDQLDEERGAFAHLIRIGQNGEKTSVADLAAYEQANNSDGAMASEDIPELRSNPHNVLATSRRFLLIDSGANALLAVRRDGQVSTRATFPTRDMKLPGSDQTVSMQSVPTAVASGPEGVLYVAELTGFPFPEAEARIYKLAPGQAPEVYLEGFTHIIDLAVDKEGTLYVLQIANTSLGAVFTTGQLAAGSVIMVTLDGDRKVLASEGLVMPTGMAIGPDGYLYISNCGICAGRGEVVRIPVDARAVEDDEGGDEGDRGREEKSEVKSRRAAGKGGDAGGSATDDTEQGNRKSDRADIHGRP